MIVVWIWKKCSVAAQGRAATLLIMFKIIRGLSRPVPITHGSFRVTAMTGTRAVEANISWRCNLVFSDRRSLLELQTGRNAIFRIPRTSLLYNVDSSRLCRTIKSPLARFFMRSFSHALRSHCPPSPLAHTRRVLLLLLAYRAWKNMGDFWLRLI